MSATIVSVKPGGWTGTAQAKDRVRRYSLVYKVRTSDPGDGPMIVGNCPGLPGYGAYYRFGNEADVGAALVSRTCRQTGEQKCWWEVADSYSSEQDERPEDQQDNPLLRPPKRRLQYERVRRVRFEDKDGKKYVTSAGEPYGPDVASEEVSLLVLSVTRNEAAIPFAVARGYLNCTNSDSFCGYGKDEALLGDLLADDNWENGVYYWAVSYKVVFDPEKWTPEKHLDKGTYYYKDGKVGEEKQTFTDSTGLATTSEDLLNGHGDKLTADAKKSGDFAYNEFRKRDRKRFRSLNLEY